MCSTDGETAAHLSWGPHRGKGWGERKQEGRPEGPHGGQRAWVLPGGRRHVPVCLWGGSPPRNGSLFPGVPAREWERMCSTFQTLSKIIFMLLGNLLGLILNISVLAETSFSVCFF